MTEAKKNIFNMNKIIVVGVLAVIFFFFVPTIKRIVWTMNPSLLTDTNGDDNVMLF